METSIFRQEIREINRKLFANDINYRGDSKTLDNIISNIIQKYDPADSIAGVPSILNLQAEDINNDIVEKIYLLNRESVILSINNDVLANNEKVAILRQLKDSGYRLIIEINKHDSIFTLAKILADIVKFDIKNVPESLFNGSNNFTCKKFAYNVDSAEDFMLAESTNIDYYEGRYISPRTDLNIRTNAHSRVNFIEIISLIHDGANIESLAKVIARDALMSAQIIRLSNSEYYGERYRIASVEEAVMKVGLQNLKRWIFLLQFSNKEKVPEELLQISYNRAIFCRRVMKETKLTSVTQDDAYLIGLFSTLDILTGKPLDSEICKLNLKTDVRDALVYREGTGGYLINLVRAYEEADDIKIDKYSRYFALNKNELVKIYFESLNEVTTLWKNLTEHGGLAK